MNPEITQEEFNKTLRKILKEIKGDTLLTLVPDIYPEVVEFFNNEVIDAIVRKRKLEDG